MLEAKFSPDYGTDVVRDTLNAFIPANMMVQNVSPMRRLIAYSPL
ncbi:hypothetical protein LCAA2362_0253 [Lacticaseibacillus casei A2-362]|nr:hypothetical protein LCAA2362_0253 [Lacticaseibacillus casei A2-362]GEL39254.1 hypothetical protein LPA06_21050 [Lacticaseibacillus paracasei subsp. tolerans]